MDSPFHQSRNLVSARVPSHFNWPLQDLLFISTLHSIIKKIHIKRKLKMNGLTSRKTSNSEHNSGYHKVTGRPPLCLTTMQYGIFALPPASTRHLFDFIFYNLKHVF